MFAGAVWLGPASRNTSFSGGAIGRGSRAVIRNRNGPAERSGRRPPLRSLPLGAQSEAEFERSAAVLRVAGPAAKRGADLSPATSIHGSTRLRPPRPPPSALRAVR